MKKRNTLILFLAFCVAGQFTTLQAQRGKKNNSNLRTKTIRGCEYEVLKGLAEITNIEVSRPADKSPLKYDEHLVLFKFIPKDGTKLMASLQDTELEYYMMSGGSKFPVGPEYIKQYQLKVGNKYTMTLYQNKNIGECIDAYTYESPYLRIDYLEIGDRSIDYIKESYVQQQMSKEDEHLKRMDEEKQKAIDGEASPIQDDSSQTAQPVEMKLPEIPLDTMEDLSSLSDQELRDRALKELEQTMKQNGGISNEFGINEMKIRKEIEAEVRERLESEYQIEEEDTKDAKPAKSASDAIKDAKRKAKDLDRKRKDDERKKREAERKRKQKEEEIRAKLESEVTAKVKAELAAKRAEDRAAKEAESQAKEAEEEKKMDAFRRKEEIKKELAENIIKEVKRKECVYENRVSGTIEIVGVTKVKDAAESYVGYIEYEVKIKFRPDNYADMAKKDKKVWDQIYLFTLDPKGKNANLSPAYIRKYKVFKTSKYKGFAEKLNMGVCNNIIFYSAKLPNDASRMKIK